KVFVRVRSKNAAGASAFSEANGTTAIAIPEAPNTLTASTKSDKQIDLAWKGANESFSREAEFIVQYSTSNTFSSPTEVQSNQNTDGVSVGNLLANTKYFFRVKSRNCSGDSPGFSNTAEATTAQAPVTKPNAPTTLKATASSSTQIDLVWSDASDNETNFELERSTDNVNFGNNTLVDANKTTLAVTGLNPNTKYFFRIRAKNTAGNSDYSNTAEATTQAPPVLALVAPNNLRLTTGTPVMNQINLEWDDRATDETAYEISRSTNVNTSFEVLKSDLPANTKAFLDKPVRSGNKYFYRVRAVRSGLFSDYSNVLEANAPLVNSVAPTLSDWQVYPNPFVETLHLDLGQPALFHIQLLNKMGGQLRKWEGQPPSSLQLADLPAGLYFLQINGDKKSKTFKITKQ
ncbi:MAG: T9SS C-terminal target domain-containing protein, partial [Runella slithyformis]